MDKSETYQLSSSRYRALCARGWPREVAESWVSDPQRSFAAGEPGLKSSQAIFVQEQGPGSKIFVKRHSRPLLKAYADWLVERPTPARRGFEVGLHLERSLVYATRPLAAIDRKWPGESFLILSLLEGRTLREVLLRKLPGLDDELERDREKTELWTALASTVARLHAARVRQRDLKSVNILVQEPRDHGGLPAVALVDLEGMQRLRGHPSRRQRARDLGRLAASLRGEEMREAGIDPPDWEQILRLYLEASKAAFPSAGDLKWWVDTTTAWADKKIVRNRRLGKQLE